MSKFSLKYLATRYSITTAIFYICSLLIGARVGFAENQEIKSRIVDSEFKIWTEDDLYISNPSDPNKTNSVRLAEQTAAFINLMANYEKKHKLIYKINKNYEVPNNDNIALHAAYNYEFKQTNEPSKEIIISAVRPAVEYAIGKKLSENEFFKGLANGISIDFNLHTLITDEEKKHNKPISYTIEPDYLVPTTKAKDSANISVDYYELEGAGRLRPVYRVVPVYQTTRYNDNMSDPSDTEIQKQQLIDSHNTNIDHIDERESAILRLKTFSKSFLSFKTKLFPNHPRLKTLLSLNCDKLMIIISSLKIYLKKMVTTISKYR